MSVDGARAGGEDALLVARGLRRDVGEQTLWYELCFELRPQERVAVQGPSGSGKTVLLRTLAGLEPLQEGTIVFGGRALDDWPMPAYRCRVTLLAQRPSLAEGPVEDVLRAPFSFRVHAERRYRREDAMAILGRVGRDEAFLERDTTNLSGGEQQIVALLRALLLEPQVLLLDEPTASLDAAATDAVEQLVALWLEGGRERAYLWTSHDAAQLARVTDRRVELHRGTGPSADGRTGRPSAGGGGDDAAAGGGTAPAGRAGGRA